MSMGSAPPASEAGDSTRPRRAPKQTKRTLLPSGLIIEELVPGRGRPPKKGDTIIVHYTGWLEKGGQKFDSSRDRKVPFKVRIGLGHLIKGWEEGVITMKVGGVRKLIIPPSLGYGDRRVGGLIPPGSTLVFEVELLGIE